MAIVSLNTSSLDEKRIQRAAAEACGSVAPNFPLDKLIAVNPFWKLIDKPFQDVSARVHALTGITALMPASYWLDLYKEGAISDKAIEHSLAQYDVGINKDIFIRTLVLTFVFAFFFLA